MKPLALASFAAIATLLAACGSDGGSNSVASTLPAPAPTPTPTPTPTPSPTPTPTPGTPATSLGIFEASRTPLPPTPASTTGTYDALAKWSAYVYDDAGIQSRVVGDQISTSGGVQLKVDADSKSYTITLAVGPTAFPAGTVTMPATSTMGYHVAYVERFSNGTTQPAYSIDQNYPGASNGTIDAIAKGYILSSVVPSGTTSSGAMVALGTVINPGNVGQVAGQPKYVSTAFWSQRYMENPTGVASVSAFHVTVMTAGTMVYGPRTAAGDMPLAGTASYALQTMPPRGPDTDEYGNVIPPNPVTNASLSVDFATRLLSSSYSFSGQGDIPAFDSEGNYLLDAEGNIVSGGSYALIGQASGSTTIVPGSAFSIALSGNGSVTRTPTGKPTEVIAQPLTGSITGAFFGPQAAEVGGFWNLPLLNSDGTVSAGVAAFAGIKQ